jgi:predicted DNA-binding protein
MLAVNVSADIETRAARVAKSTGRPLAAVVEAALSEGLSELEEIEEAESRLEDIRSG